MSTVIRALCAVGLAAVSAAGPAHAQSPDPCAGWTVRDVATGLGVIENLEPDGEGGLFISTGDDVVRVLPDGSSSTFVTLDRTGGLRVRGPYLYVNTGNGFQSGLLGTPDGTLTRIDRATGATKVMADGLVMPNGLVFDDVGFAWVSRDFSQDFVDQLMLLPDEASISRIAPDGTVTRWAEVADTNGLAIDSTGTWMYAATTFNLSARVIRIRMDDPSRIEVVAELLTAGGLPIKGLDDLDIDADDVLYITANPAGEVIRLDPSTGEACVVADGLLFASAVKFGRGPGWSEQNLYVVTWQGGIHELIPPGGSPALVTDDLGSQPRPAGPADNRVPQPEPLAETGGGLAAVALGAVVLAGAGRRRRRH